MTREEVLKASPDELRVMVALERGWTGIGEPTLCMELWGNSPGGDGSYPDLVPDWPRDIAAAWELDGEGWFWKFDEWIDGVEVIILKRHEDQASSLACQIWENWNGSKTETYATARCRAWLLTRIEEGTKG